MSDKSEKCVWAVRFNSSGIMNYSFIPHDSGLFQMHFMRLKSDCFNKIKFCPYCGKEIEVRDE